MSQSIIQFIALPFVQSLVTVVHICTCVLLILVVLIQSGKGAEISASFSGSSQTVFGSSGGANFFTHFTRGAAALFMVTSILLTVGGAQNKGSVMERMGGSSTPTSACTVGIFGTSQKISTTQATVPRTSTLSRPTKKLGFRSCCRKPLAGHAPRIQPNR